MDSVKDTRPPAKRQEKSSPRAKRLPFAALPHELHGDVRLADKTVRLAATLLVYARDKTNCWPSNATLARDLHCQSRCVQVHLKKLVGAGYVRVELGAHVPNPTHRLIHLVWREQELARVAACALPPPLDAPPGLSERAPESSSPEKERTEKAVAARPSEGPVAGLSGEPTTQELLAWAEGDNHVLRKIGRAALGMAGGEATGSAVQQGITVGAEGHEVSPPDPPSSPTRCRP